LTCLSSFGIPNVPTFSRFLKVAAHCNGTIVNFTNVASDAQVARTTVYEYFEIHPGAPRGAGMAE
jgi:hypothetical protein